MSHEIALEINSDLNTQTDDDEFRNTEDNINSRCLLIRRFGTARMPCSLNRVRNVKIAAWESMKKTSSTILTYTKIEFYSERIKFSQIFSFGLFFLIILMMASFVVLSLLAPQEDKALITIAFAIALAIIYSIIYHIVQCIKLLSKDHGLITIFSNQ
ncbi:hypothetical protein TNIN_95782 [Trichonephila inaurata madagascariensis]|uniref:Uncharacterized protein n=1 Tax=Trichonephila inaurata madagascariensis TaxID=2747483 RepID=A0A8X6X7E5_9ARAC|nr:hypothetical protein TNIN_95782 [Trichonephila inaurata madagascariensis]